jgi:glycosyltransferase involved in cell wall biosynthesis
MWHLRTALWFQDHGHEVKMLLRKGPLADKAFGKGLPVKTIPMAFDLDIYSFFISCLYFLKEKPDLILLNDQRECRLIAPAAAVCGVKVRLQRKGWPFLKGSWRDKLLYRFGVTDLIVSSEAVYKVFAEKSGLPEDRITIVLKGLDLKDYEGHDPCNFRDEHKIPHKDIVLGSTGRLVSQKGFDVLIKAVSKLNRRGLDIWAVIAGEGPLRDELQELIKEAGLEDKVLLPGFIDNVPGFLSSLDIFIQASRMESRSYALSEGMAAGLPVITNDAPGNDELVENEKSGLIVPVDNPEALSDAVERLMKNMLKSLAQKQESTWKPSLILIRY